MLTSCQGMRNESQSFFQYFVFQAGTEPSKTTCFISSEPASFAIYNFGFFEMTTRSIMGLFMFMAGWWFVTTLYGLSTIHKRNIIAHKVCMIRSYAMAMTAVTFRVYHILFYLLGWDHLENYELSLWISVIGNMFFAEWVIWRQSKQYIKSFAT